MDTIQQLLNEIANISAMHEQIDQNTGRCFNIFDIVNISDKEVQICRVIYELINPKGCHYQKGKYLKLFCETVLGFNPSIEECNNAYVDKEHIITEHRRIDIYIEIANKIIPIEAKIYAGDQNAQLYDYYNYARSKVYYLTLHGDNPSNESKKDLSDNDFSCISFGKHILDWLSVCLKDKETVKLAPIREVLLQFEAVIRSLTGQLEEDKAVAIKDVLTNSSENMKTAVAISQTLNEINSSMKKMILCNIGDRLKNKYKDFLKEYTFKTTSKYSEIVFDISKNYEFAVEIDWRLFAGIYDIKAEEFVDNWEYLPNGGNEKSCSDKEIPDFHNCNEAFCNLFDELHREKFIDCSMKVLDSLIEKAKKYADK